MVVLSLRGWLLSRQVATNTSVRNSCSDTYKAVSDCLAGISVVDHGGGENRMRSAVTRSIDMEIATTDGNAAVTSNAITAMISRE